MNLSEVLNFRRSVRVFDETKEIEPAKIKNLLKLSSLSPNSSNMQLWEFYHITEPALLAAVSKACLDQTAALTASQIVVFVSRQDLHKKRAKAILEIEKMNILRNSPKERQEKRIKDQEKYYGKLMPFAYSRFFGLLGMVRVTYANIMGLFRPFIRDLSESDMRIVVHKSSGLAAQTFMIAMANEGYDTCPMEGYDSKRLKKILKLPSGAEITMVIPCGIRKGNDGIWGERGRLDFEEIYHKL